MIMSHEMQKVALVLETTELSFDELTTEIHKACIMSTWVCFHNLRKEGLITASEKGGILYFSLSPKGRGMLTTIMGTNENSSII
ncbi:MAG: hypothetical protein AB7F25_02840 [Deferribacterales bacterium]